MEHDNAGTPQCLLINLCMVLVVGYLVNEYNRKEKLYRDLLTSLSAFYKGGNSFLRFVVSPLSW